MPLEGNSSNLVVDADSGQWRKRSARTSSRESGGLQPSSPEWAAPVQLMHNRLSSIAEAKLSDELANQALGGFKNLFEKSFEKGVAQILEVRIILTCALVGVA